jgi:hypothetical protein
MASPIPLLLPVINAFLPYSFKSVLRQVPDDSMNLRSQRDDAGRNAFSFFPIAAMNNHDSFLARQEGELGEYPASLLVICL